MGWNYRKRIKIAPGVYVNLSKRGVSTTIGARGASVNIGKNGTYLNTGLPGTGLYKRQKLSSSTKKQDYEPAAGEVSSNDSWGCMFGLIALVLTVIVIFAFVQSVRAGVLFLFVSIFILCLIALINLPSSKNSSAKKEETNNESGKSPAQGSNHKGHSADSVGDAADVPSEITRYEGSGPISESYFYDVNSYISGFMAFAENLNRDQAFKESCGNLESVSIELTEGTFGKTDPHTFKGKLLILMLADIIRNFEYAGHKLNVREKEQFGILLYMIRIYGSVEIRYDYMPIYCKDGLVDCCQNLANQMLALPVTEEKFLLSHLLSDYSSELMKKYHIMLYRIISLTSKCDGVVTEKESSWMKEVMALAEPSHSVKSETAEARNEKQGDKASYLKLDELIGLSSVKQEVNSLTNLIKIQQKREREGMKVVNPSYHCVFTGNPGTGKTTVARIVAGIYHDLGILKKGQLIETDRSGLVAEYVGQTAVKTNKIIDKALDGVLFIDEAYTLVSAGETDYGKEAIATLLKRMEDDRDRLVVILAGYTNEMKKFIDSNPGLQSRFSRYIEFPDYSDDELMKIFESSLKKYEYSLSPEAKDKLSKLFAHAVATKDVNFGNGRFVRNIFDKTIERQSNRLATLPSVSVKQLSEIITEDIPDIK